MQRPSRAKERQNAQGAKAQSAWTKTSKELDRELRKHVLAEMRQSHAVEASVLAARKILPMNYLFERDIQECRDRMRRAVVDVLKRMQAQAKALAWRRWKRHLHLLELEETRNKAEMDLLIKQAKSLRTLERLARRALQGRPRVYLMHWKSQINAMIHAERRSAAGTIQRCYRGHVGRRRAARRVAALERMRQRNSDAVCATAFLERRATLVRMYNAKRRARAAQCEAAAMRIQLLFRRYCAQRHVAFLANRKAGDLRLQQAAIKMQSAWRKRLALRAAQNVRDARRAVNIALARKIAMRNRAALVITRVGRGAIGRQEAHIRRLEREYLSRAAERIQKFYRVKNGSYALSVRIAARREREKREAAARRQYASIVIQCFARRNRARKRAREARQAREFLLARKNLAAERLQIFWWRCQGQYELARRCATRRDELARQNASATRIQKVIRGVQTRRRVTRFRTHTRAALVIQHLARSWLAIRKVNRKREQRRRRLARMATLIQNMVRVRAALKRTGELRRRRAATGIQCMIRSHFARAVRRLKARERTAATRIQARVRGMLARSFYQALREKTAATILQTQVWRPRLARSRVQQARTLNSRARARREANLVWVLTRRTRCARVIQCRARILIARRRFIELVRAYRNEAACVIQRAVRVLLAKCAVKRAYQGIAARKIQRFWQQILERRVLQRRFQDRRKLLDRQDVCARTLQRVWRAHRGRKRFQKLLKLEKGRVIQEEYKHERKLKMEKDKERLARKEARQNRRREALGRFREEAYLSAVKSRTKLRETEGFQIPGWAENLCSLDLLERVLKHEKRRHEIDRAWTEVPVDETQPESDCYFYNELTGHSQWEVPDCIAQERAREARDAERSDKAAALVQVLEAKRTARPAETLLCRRNVPWVSALAMCNRPATLHCHHCNEVFCEACAERAHKRGPAKNHALLIISELENKSVCIVCENQLANRHCKPCGDDFCENCWKLTHRTAAREKHVFETYSRFTRPELEYGDRWCPYCELAPAARNCKHCGDIYCVECYEEFHENGRRRTHVWTPANNYAVWKKLYDVASSRYYYFNTFTEESTWEKPAAILQREEDEDAGRPVTEGLRRVQEREAAENEDSDNPIPGQIRVLEEEVAHLQEWKAEMDRQNEEDDAAEAEEAIRAFRSGAKAKKAQLFSFLRQKRTLEEEVFYEQKAYLERMLRDEATKDIGIDAALTGTELSRNAYEAKLLQDMAEARVAIRKDAHRLAVEQMSNDLFKKRVAKATKEFRGVSNSHQLVLECKKAGIKYGPDYLGAGKMTKTEAIEKLVIWRYEQEIEQKHRLEDQANLLKDTEKIRKRLARLEAGPGERAKGPASRFGGILSRFPKA